MFNRLSKNAKKVPATVMAALVGLIGTCLTVICSSPVLVKIIEQVPKGSPTSVSEIIQTPAFAKNPTITVEIVGPDTVPFGQKTYFTFISYNATRADWSIGGFEENEIFVVEPLAPSHQIFVEVTDGKRIGDKFVIAVTVYNQNGETASATKQFIVVNK